MDQKTNCQIVSRAPSGNIWVPYSIVNVCYSFNKAKHRESSRKGCADLLAFPEMGQDMGMNSLSGSLLFLKKRIRDGLVASSTGREGSERV